MNYTIIDPNKIYNCNNQQYYIIYNSSQKQSECSLPFFIYPIEFNQSLNNDPTQNKTNNQMNQNTIINISDNNNNIYKIYSKKEIYGKGNEAQKLKKLPHFNEPFEDLEMYILLGRPDKKRINEIGEEYNIRFRNEIKEGLYPKFSRSQKRNKALAVWFFEDCKTNVKSWLKEIGLIDKSI